MRTIRCGALSALTAVSWILVSACGSGGTPTATIDVAGEALTTPDGVESDGEVACVPDCYNKSCGPDGCGGECGTCPDYAPECQNFLCIATCQPVCEGKECGSDSCGGSCGTCPDGSECKDGTCGPVCVPECEGKECGVDGCGGVCGSCAGDAACVNGQCVEECNPDCTGKECGSDGCDGTCGDCGEGLACQEGQCAACTPDCEGKQCGPDGCDGACGECGEGSACQESQCVACTPDCEGKECGPDGCDGVCGQCAVGTACEAGTCVACAPDCGGKECGDDGCGGSCGQCSDTVLCTIDSCQAGACKHVSQDTICDDMKQCTSDTCDPVAGCVNEVSEGAACEDWEQCTVGDTCDAAGTCQPGAWSTDPECGDECSDTECGPDTNLCDGTVAYNPESCKCEPVPGTQVECPAGTNPCAVQQCIPETGACEEKPLPKGASCDDGLSCTINDACDGGGKCGGAEVVCSDGDACNGMETCDPTTGACGAGIPLVCDDGNVCTSDSCDPVEDCVYTPADVPCADADPCNGTEMCVAGVCTPGVPLSADDGISCTEDYCGPDGPYHIKKDGHCDDKNPCTADFCDLLLDCVHNVVPGLSCSDDNLCNGLETCQADQCVAGSPLVCDDGSPCTDDTCDPLSGCKSVPNDFNSCSDGDACNGVEICSAGTCKAQPAPVCDDGNPCTDDGCDKALGCTKTNDDTNSCADATVCNGKEVCVAGACVPGAPLKCVDANECTEDKCDPIAGCSNPPVKNGTPCFTGGQNACKNGQCVCTPSCGGKKCGSDGCTGTCGTCAGSEKCIDFQCTNAYSCVEMMACGLQCGFTAQCILSCYGQGAPSSQALFQAYAFCVVSQCGLNVTPTCVMLATAGACSATYAACAAD